MNVATHIVTTGHSIHADSDGWNDPATWAAMAAALGTLVLAFFTWRVAARTRDLAVETGKDVRAEWRPVIIPDGDGLNVQVELQPNGAVWTALDGQIRNGGRGPALNIILVCTSANSVTTKTSDTAHLGTMAVGEQPRRFVFANVLAHDPSPDNPRIAYTITARYEDLAGRVHRSEITYGELTVAWSQLPGPGSTTGWSLAGKFDALNTGMRTWTEPPGSTSALRKFWKLRRPSATT